jgi:hypothetical protein
MASEMLSFIAPFAVVGAVLVMCWVLFRRH